MSTPIHRGDRVTVDTKSGELTGTVTDTDGHWATVKLDGHGHIDKPNTALRPAPEDIDPETGPPR